MKNYLKKVAVLSAFVFAANFANAQNIAFATSEVSITVADVIAIVDAGNNPLNVGTELTASNLGLVSFSYPNAASYQAAQTASSGTFNVSASTPFQVEVRAAAANFTSSDVAVVGTIPVTVLNITGTAATGVTVTPILAGALTTTYQDFATGGIGAVMPITPSYTIPAAQALDNIFGVPTGTYTVDVFYQVSAL